MATNVNTGAPAPNKPFASRKRLRKGGFITAGKGVVVTNPKAAPAVQAHRTPSLGMGGITQYNRT